MTAGPPRKSFEALSDKVFKDKMVKDSDRILDYIGHMALELAQLAAQIGRESLGSDLITLADKAKAEARACRDDSPVRKPLATDPG